VVSCGLVWSLLRFCLRSPAVLGGPILSLLQELKSVTLKLPHERKTVLIAANYYLVASHRCDILLQTE